MVQAAEKAHEMLPSRKDVAGNLLLLYTRTGQRQPAQRLVDRFFALQGTPAELAEAQTQVAYLDLEKAYDLLRAEDAEGAAEILARLEAMPLGGQNAPRAAQQIERLRQDVAQQSFNIRFNEAVEKFNAGDYAAAEALIQELLPSTPAGQATEQVESLLEESRRRLGKSGS